LIKSSTRQTLFNTAEFVGRERFNLTYIDNAFNQWLTEHPGVKPGFNTPYLKALYGYGYAKARSAHLWTHIVPLPGSAGQRLKEMSQAR
jgi:hypothetical protein